MKLATGCGLSWWMDLQATHSEPDITASLRMILRGLLAALGMWRLEPAHGIALYGRINRVFASVERMLLRFRAGTLRRVARRTVVQRQGGGSAGRGPALPRRFGWLVIAGKHQAVCYGLQLRTVLAMPEMAAMLEASPQARRVLRPLCRALAVELPWTVTPPRAPRPRRARAPRPKPEPFKIPLPRGVITWARREAALEKAKQRLR